MGAQHTPGPWSVDDFICSSGQRSSLRYVRATGSRHWAVARVPSNTGCSDPNRDIGDEERDANARLIAAAPDLLEALEMALSALFHFASADDRSLADQLRLAKARAAIAKATGAAA